MIDFSTCAVRKIIAHEVGNKLRDEGVAYSSKNLKWSDDETEQLFLRYALSSFKSEEFFQFMHSTDLQLNEIYTYVSKIFDNPKEFDKQSKNIALHLYNKSIHPKILRGELYLVYLENCMMDNVECDAIGIYKSETKESYLKPQREENGYTLRNEKGVNISRLDKACLIFNINKDTGFKLSIVDGSGKSDETQYWRDHFLLINSCNDSHHQTKNFLTLAKTFVTDQLSEEYAVTNTDKAEYLKRSVEYFENNDQFNERSFTKEVFGQPDVIKSFQRFKDDYVAQNDVELSAEFSIAPQVVKKQASAFRSILKLDKNFHVYIHGDTDLIQHGVEKDGRKYYKIYYQNES